MTKPKPKLTPRAPGAARAPVDERAADALLARLEAREHAPPGAPAPSASAPATNDPRDVVRKGRLRADGSRSGAKVLRRLTIYLPPELAQKLDVEAATSGRDKSELVAEALAERFSR